MVPMLSLPGSRLVAAMKSPSVLNGEFGIDGEDQIEGADGGHHRVVAHRIERQVLEQRDADRGAVGDQPDGVAVRRRVDHGVGGADAAGAGHVLDHEALAELVAELLGDEARGDVGDAARPERQHDLHRDDRDIFAPAAGNTKDTRSAATVAATPKPRISFCSSRAHVSVSRFLIQAAIPSDY